MAHQRPEGQGRTTARGGGLAAPVLGNTTSPEAPPTRSENQNRWRPRDDSTSVRRPGLHRFTGGLAAYSRGGSARASPEPPAIHPWLTACRDFIPAPG